MAYSAPHIDAAGLHIPSYADIRDDLIAEFRRIYGQDIYLDNDSQDYQMISAFALKTYDMMQMLQIIYNNRSPKTAVGTALDGIVKLNGIRRKAASYSTCILTLSGDIGTTIRGGVAGDTTGETKWSLPDEVIIKENPQRITAICKTIGAIEAMPGSITKIVTPTKGWISVTNDVPAVVGTPIEKDEKLRQRQSDSVAIPSVNMIDGMIGGIAAVDGVKRYKAYDNDTNLTDKNGIPGHTVAVVVEGGLDADIAREIYLRKGPGCGTYGDESFEYTSTDNLVNKIRFNRPRYVLVNVEIKIKKGTAYTQDARDKVIESIRNYLDDLGIGENVLISSVWGAALSVLSTLTHPEFSVREVKIGKTVDELALVDIEIAFNEVSRSGEITVIEV